MYKFIILAASAAFASAYTTPTSQCTNMCNPIAKPGLNEVVPAGTPYQITWAPTTGGTVSLVLLKGPSENIIPVYAVAEKIPNTGIFSWTPAADLEPTGNSGYGFQIIDDADGTYQWSTQFGIANEAYTHASASGSASVSAPFPSGSASAGHAVAHGNGTIGSAAATSSAPSHFSNSTAVITSPSSEATDATTTFSRITSAGVATASPSTSVVSSENAAVALSAFGVVGSFAAILAAVAAL